VVPESACQRQRSCWPIWHESPWVTAADHESLWLVARVWPVTTVHIGSAGVEDFLEF
jgi:hypothetical protein